VLHGRKSCGRPFQIRGPATEKRRSPSEVTVRGTLSMYTIKECIERTGLCGCNILFKYGGVPNFTALKQSQAVLNSIWKECSRSELGA